MKEQLEKQLKSLERAKIARESLRRHGVNVLAQSLDQCFGLANRYAPEHLVIASDAAESLLKKVHNAGTVFLGHYTPVAVGDYLAGPNHVLPTGGTARFFSPLGVDDFLKRTAFVRFEPPKLRELGSDVIRLAELEGFTGHGQSVELRLAKIRRVDPLWGEAVTGVVVAREGSKATLEELIRFCKDRLASYKRPKKIFFVDDLPKNLYGKVLRKELKKQFQDK